MVAPATAPSTDDSIMIEFSDRRLTLAEEIHLVRRWRLEVLMAHRDREQFRQRHFAALDLPFSVAKERALARADFRFQADVEAFNFRLAARR